MSMSKYELSRRHVSNSINIVKPSRDITTNICKYVIFTYLHIYFYIFLYKARWQFFRAEACSSLVTIYCYIINMFVFCRAFQI